MTQSVVLRDVEASYGSQLVLKGFNLEVRSGEFLAILGPSGCGKSTLLNLIAGFLTPAKGKIFVGQRDVTNMPPQGRNLSMVFQSYALFPHMTVLENVAYGLKVRRLVRADIERRAHEALRIVGLEGYDERFPRQLSGGQQQRVSLARAMVVEPEVLLLDEPLSNLDAKLRREMRVEIKALQRRLQTTTVLVTHDQDEALSMADRVAVMHDGHLQQIASPLEVYRSPSSHFVAEFVGRTNSFAGRLTGATTPVLEIAPGFAMPVANGLASDGERRVAVVRPEAIRLHRPDAAGVSGHLGVAKYLGFLGSNWECSIELDSGHLITATLRPDVWVPQEGERAVVDWHKEDVILLADR